MRKLKNEELNRLSVENYHNHPKNPLILMLDDVRSLHNVGSAFRTADAFLLEKIILCGITGKPPHREINKTALGATESVSWEYHNDPMPVLGKLKESGYQVLSVEQADQSVPLHVFMPDINKRYVLVFGNELSGVKESIVERSDHVIEIPQFGTKHSLNISVSIGIVIWDIVNKLKLVS
jgi:23S rRNA (guanosine2251-2'-O)-methyltransferase